MQCVKHGGRDSCNGLQLNNMHNSSNILFKYIYIYTVMVFEEKEEEEEEEKMKKRNEKEVSI